MLELKNYFRDNNCVSIKTDDEHIRRHEDDHVTVSIKDRKENREFTLKLGDEEDLYFRFQSPKDEELRDELDFVLRQKAHELSKEFTQTAIRLLGAKHYGYVNQSDLERSIEARMKYEVTEVINEVLCLKGI